MYLVEQLVTLNKNDLKDITFEGESIYHVQEIIQDIGLYNENIGIVNSFSGGMRDLELKFNNFSELVENKDDLYLSDYIEIYDIKYDNVIYISDKRLLLKEFIDYLKKEE